MRRRSNKMVLLPLAALAFVAATPISVRASCDHPGGSFSAFITPARPLPPLSEEAEARVESSQGESKASIPKHDPVPCVRCGGGTKGLPSAPSLRLEREPALAGDLLLLQGFERCLLGHVSDALYSLELVRELERPPRAG